MLKTTMWMAAVAVVLAATSAQAAGPCCAPAVVPKWVEKVIQVPTWVAETRTVQCVEYRPEVREKTVTVAKSVPVERTVDRQYTVMVPKTQKKTVQYTVAKPVWEEKEVEHTVMVPRQETKQGVRRVCRAVPVTETRSVWKDEGNWEEHEVTVSPVRQVCYQTRRMARRARRLGSCCSPCELACEPCTVTQTCKVWVPNLVETKVEVTVMKPEMVEEPYEYTVTRCEPEVRTTTVRVCRMEYEQKAEEVEHVVWVPETQTRTLTYTSYECQTEEKTVSHTVMVPHEVQREVQVWVCRMVAKTVKCLSCCP